MKHPYPPLAIIDGPSGELDRYDAYLRHSIAAFSPKLLEEDVWTNELITEIFGFPWPCRARHGWAFSGPSIVVNELKAYISRSLADDRKRRTNWFLRCRAIIRFVTEQYTTILSHFNVECISDIPHPCFTSSNNFPYSKSNGRAHNKQLLSLYADWCSVNSDRKITQSCLRVKRGLFIERKYYAPDIQIIGSVHYAIVVHRSQTKPLRDRDIIYINDLYSEEDTRFKDCQKLNDRVLNLFKLPPWMRPAVRAYLFDKVEHGELAPNSLAHYAASFSLFRDFLYERFEAPTPAVITSNLMAEFLNWGNRRNAAGKNWYTNVVQFLAAAPRLLIGEWPSLTLDKRAARKIHRLQAADANYRLYASKEGANRAAPDKTIRGIFEHLDDLPAPIPAMFIIGVGTGIRAGDLHALLFDCLRPDKHDKRFMILSFWQNKVSRWNHKPLLKTDPLHQAMINAIEGQRAAIRQRLGRDTKYLFPTFSGQRESFLHSNYTVLELKKLCIRHGILGEDGKPFNFTWHPIRHHHGTQMALEGHDILSIMLELGHASPDMATCYVNRRLELKKNALLKKGGGRFYTIEGQVDAKVGELLIRKEQVIATRVSGGACTLPGQLGEWCEHAHACLSCRNFRAASGDYDYFRCEKHKLLTLIEQQDAEIRTFEESGQRRLAELTKRRQVRNKNAAQSVDNIIRAIERDGSYAGTKHNFLRTPE
ncbi:MAG TPA: tyrosine-type recombinase/integrase [Azospirillum sp.]|nr:tyrosine-type recombinase/integrase [Azospirillum sp.]